MCEKERRRKEHSNQPTLIPGLCSHCKNTVWMLWHESVLHLHGALSLSLLWIMSLQNVKQGHNNNVKLEFMFNPCLRWTLFYSCYSGIKKRELSGSSCQRTVWISRLYYQGIMWIVSCSQFGRLSNNLVYVYCGPHGTQLIQKWRQ